MECNAVDSARPVGLWAGDKPERPDLGQAILIVKMCCMVLAQG